ncbi:MAG: alcohol dehydrogenase catalytic domain-containing protein [Candidatus Lokiarchaeota archaeon]
MKAAIYNGKKVEVREVEKPTISDSEILVKVKAAGICGTDLAILKGNLPTPTPIILGHEFSGDIVKIGKNVSNDLINKRVTSEINTNIDFSCYFCKKHLYTQCVSRKALGIDVDGVFAEYIKLPEYLIHKIPDNLTYEEASFIEPLAAAYQVFELMPIEKDDKNITVFGLGKLGLLITQIALGFNLNVIVVDGSPYKLRLAQKFGVNHALNRFEIDNIPYRIKEITNGLGSDIIVDATGNPKAISDIISSCRTRGKIHVKSTPGLPVQLNLTEIVVREITLFSSRCGPFEKAISGLQSGDIDVNQLISSRFPLQNIEKAFKSYEQPNHIKSVLTFD